MAQETTEQMKKDSDMIFTQIIGGNFHNFDIVKVAIVRLYATDMNISRAGINHALGRLEKFFKEKRSNNHVG